MLVDVGKRQPLEADAVYHAIDQNPPDAEHVAFVWDGQSRQVHHLRSMTAEALIEHIGPDEFARVETHDSDDGSLHRIDWFRRSMIREVVPVPDPITKELGRGSLLQMLCDEPMPQPWPPKRRMLPAYTWYFSELSVEQAERLLGL